MKTNFANNPKKIEKEPLPSPNYDKSISGLGLLNSVKSFMLTELKVILNYLSPKKARL